MTDLAAEVRRRAEGLCEYYRIPEGAFRRPFHIEHVIARQHGGETELDNLALACWACNLKKGPNLTGIDPRSKRITPLFDPRSKRITPLFDPRKHRWADHFAFSVGIAIASGIEIRGLTAVGRTTVIVLGMNTEMRRMIRYEL